MSTHSKVCDTDLSWLQLPPRKPFQWHSVSFQYGAAAVAARHCGLSKPPAYMVGEWAHGWIPENHQLDPRCVIKDIHKVEKVWVARKDEEIYLKSEGFEAEAIGLPISYTIDEGLHRKPGSLLVLPPHSSSVVACGISEADVAEQLLEHAKYVDQLVVCVHNHCAKTGQWVRTLDSYGIPFVFGADHQDENSLQRMRNLFQQFEFVNTLGYSSAMAYAAAFGAKVSVTGPHLSTKAEDFRWAPYYQDNPGLLELQASCATEDVLQQLWPFFFTEPHMASLQLEWGQKQIGFDRRISPKRMRSCFGWGLVSFTKRRIKSHSLRLAKRIIPEIRAVSPKQRQQWNTQKDVEKAITSSANSSVLEIACEKFYINSEEEFREGYLSAFEREIFRVPSVSESPTMLDCGANIGLATRYWLKKYPKAKIIAFEPDSEIFSLLKRNCAEVPDADVTLENAAVWTEDTMLASDGTGEQVRAVDLTAYLGEPIDLLKMEIEGAECDVLPALDGRLQNVFAMYVEYHSYIGRDQGLADILKVLETNGFRYTFQIKFGSDQPMRKIEERNGMDMRLHLWAWKPE